MKKLSVPFQGKTLAVYTNEQTGKMPIVLIHGNSMSSKIWRKQFDSDLATKYFLVAYDLPGHGESDHFETYSLKMLSDSISAVINYFPLSNYVLVGNSLGGDLILQEYSNLSNCRGIVLLGCPPIKNPPNAEQVYLPSETIGMFYSAAYDKHKLNTFASEMFSGNDIPSFIVEDYERNDGKARQSIGAVITEMSYADEVAILENIQIPVAIMAGENDKLVNNSYFKTLRVPRLWNNQPSFISDSAHCPQWENAPAFNNLLDSFVKAVNQVPAE